MGFNHRYKVIIEDETTLERKVNLSGKFVTLLSLLCAFILIIVCAGIFFLAVTPMKTVLPGYLKESERAATEEQHLRLDSLLQVYEANQYYIDNLFNVLSPSDPDTTIFVTPSTSTPLSTDSLLPQSQEERNFMESIRERDKYTIHVVNPYAESLMFESLNPNAVISEDTRNSYVADIILPYGAPVSAVAEGKVISISTSPKTGGGFEVIIQHPNGFLSKSSRLGPLLISDGDRVTAGQIIAEPSRFKSARGNLVSLELWHDGNKLIPARYIKGGEIN